MNSSPTTTVDLLRHGEPAGGRKFRGSVDDPLSELGWQQMRAAAQAAEAGGEATWDRVISSPLLRSGEFAAELATQRNLPIEVWGDVREMLRPLGGPQDKSPVEIGARATAGVLQ